MSDDARAFETCIAGGGVAVFPSDTVYGLACDPEDATAVRRLYRLKGRPLEKPSAVMFFSVRAALPALAALGPGIGSAAARVLPGALSLLVPNPAGSFPLACGDDPSTLGLRVPDLPALASMPLAVLQSSANLAGGPDPRRVADIPASILEAVDLVLDGGELPGTPSTVVDLREYEQTGAWRVVREGAVGRDALTVAFGRSAGTHW